MNTLAKILCIALFISLAHTSPAQSSAQWITAPGADPHAFGVYLFRKTIALSAKPAAFTAYVSGDNRYQLFVNGKRVSVGPAKGDPAHWRYETVDLAPALQKGNNTIAALVWNEGEFLSWSQTTLQTGFLLVGIADGADIVNTNPGWKVMQNKAYGLPNKNYIVSPFENVNAANYPWGWEQNNYNDNSWTAAETVMRAYNAPARTLVASTIPPPEETSQRFKTRYTISKNSTGEKLYNNISDDAFIKGTSILTIPANDSISLLIDQGSLTTAYPELLVSGGKGATITITYAEALYDSKGNKGNRNEINGKTIKGNADLYMPDGGSKRLYRPLFYRCFRYVELKIKTAAEPLRIEDFHSVFTGYPFKENAVFNCSDPSIKTIWNTGWHTARLCAYETYMDCPYYEQLQYVGDTRIQALVSYSVSGDDRLIRNAIELYNNSFTPDGLTHSRYPESQRQIIPPFSLFWIDMLHDYWRYRPDTAFIRPYFSNIKRVLDWHAQYIDTYNLLAHMPNWNFVDWPKEWPWGGMDSLSGIPAGTLTGHSSILTLQYVYGLQRAIELFKAFGYNDEAAHYQAIVDKLKPAILKLCWNPQRQLLADDAKQTEYSQHANVMAVLTNLFAPKDEAAIMKRVVADSTLIQCTYYYRFYLNQAMKKAGLGDEYIAMLQPWRNMIALGLSTFAERPEPTRSDCHAWSASPNYDLLATVAGIEPASPGFKTVSIHPHMGPLQWINGKMPTASGSIVFVLKRSGPYGVAGKITLPKGMVGVFVWGGTEVKLREGEQEVAMAKFIDDVPPKNAGK